jgi:hypothetical protein
MKPERNPYLSFQKNRKLKIIQSSGAQSQSKKVIGYLKRLLVERKEKLGTPIIHISTLLKPALLVLMAQVEAELLGQTHPICIRTSANALDPGDGGKTR